MRSWYRTNNGPARLSRPISNSQFTKHMVSRDPIEYLVILESTLEYSLTNDFLGLELMSHEVGNGQGNLVVMCGAILFWLIFKTMVLHVRHI